MSLQRNREGWRVKSGLLMLLFLWVLFAAVPAAEANIIIAINDWDTAPASGLGSWSARGSSATVSENIDDTSDHYMEIKFPSGGGSGSEETVSTPSDDLFAGTWLTDNWIEFDFWASNTLPDTLQIRWHGTASDTVYGNTVTPVAGAGGWQTLKSATFSSVDDWSLGQGANQSDFLADLESIDWIGAYMYQDGSDSRLYGIDDFKLMVPEPSQYLMLAAALLAVLLLLRQQRKSVSAVGAESAVS